MVEKNDRNVDRMEWSCLGDDEGQKRFGIKPMQVFNELKGTSWK